MESNLAPSLFRHTQVSTIARKVQFNVCFQGIPPAIIKATCPCCLTKGEEFLWIREIKGQQRGCELCGHRVVSCRVTCGKITGTFCSNFCTSALSALCPVCSLMSKVFQNRLQQNDLSSQSISIFKPLIGISGTDRETDDTGGQFHYMLELISSLPLPTSHPRVNTNK